jgi:serine/threonine-protein kinase
VESVRTGRRFAGRYVLADRIGVGGMAEVWRGTDEVLARPVAVKVIDPALLDDPEFRARFRAEARAAAGLSHPRVVTVHDYGEEGGTPYIVMELLDGETLADRLGRGPLPPGAAAAVCGQIAAALAAAHEAGLVHRDVKPANVHLTRDGVKVLDFGVAARGGSGPDMGTPAYLAPEQITRDPVTPAADVFALGVVLFEALTGRRPFADDQARTERPPLPPDTPAELADLCARCLAADPAERPAAAVVAAALERFAPEPGAYRYQDRKTDRHKEPPETRGARPRTSVLADPAGVRRRRLLAAGGALAGVVVVVAAAAYLPRGGAGDPPPVAVSAVPTSPANPASTTGVINALISMRRTVDEGAAAGEVRPDVALDFGNVISDLQGRLAAGEPVDVTQRVAQLRTKIDQRLREGGLSAERAHELHAALSGIS